MIIFNVKKNNRFKRLTIFLTIIVFVGSLVMPVPKANPQTVFGLPTPGTMVALSPVFTPPLLLGITLYPDDPLKINFLIHPGDDQIKGEEFQQEAQKIIDYFMAALAVPEDELWVNLSPYEENRIIADGLSRTEMGRDMLAQDYILKQLTASLMYPENELGRNFWERVHRKKENKFENIDIPVDIFNKIWIVPDKASVVLSGNTVYVGKSHLKVMLEEDYLALERNQNSQSHGLRDIHRENIDVIAQEVKEIIREILLPEIEREVNEGKNFSNLRQIYNSMLLATWYKRNLKKSVLGNLYVDQNKVEGIDLADKKIKEKIYDQYLKAFKVGVYDYIKEEYDLSVQEVIPKRYFSGGLTDFGEIEVEKDSAMVAKNNSRKDSMNVEVDLSLLKKVSDQLANADDQEKESLKGLVFEVGQH